MLLATDRIIGILGVVGVIVGTGVALATGAKTRGEITFAKACFILSGSSVGFLAILWYRSPGHLSFFQGAIAVSICSAVFLFTVRSVTWASTRPLIEDAHESWLDEYNRQQFLKQIRLNWVDPVLKQPLYKVARIDLGFEENEDAVERPVVAVLRRGSDRTTEALRPGASVGRIFDDSGGELLILGAPGAGKTTILHELARDLIDVAQKDHGRPMPAIFPLSSWADKRLVLDEWLIQQLRLRSGVPERLARLWIQTDRIIPLLDGLDEVAAQHRTQCVRAINRFRESHGLLSLVVCSRSADYEALASKLHLRTAIVVKPLPKTEIKSYLDRAGGPLHPLRRALERDADLQELLDTPLMLSIALLAYEKRDVVLPSGDNNRQRRRRLFGAFVDAVLERSGITAHYRRTEILSWLRWLAVVLKRQEQTYFYLEDLRASWLGTTRLRVWFHLASLGLCGSTGALFGAILGSLWAAANPWWIPLPLGLVFGVSYGVLIGLPTGIIVGIVGSFIDVSPVERLSPRLSGIGTRIWSAIRIGIPVTLAGVITFSLLIRFVFGRSGSLYFHISRIGYFSFTNFHFGVSVASGVSLGAAFALVRLFSDETVKVRRFPNEGTVRSAVTALSIAVVYSLGCWAYAAFRNPTTAISGMTTGGVIAGLAAGGLFSIRHFAVRIVLWIFGFAPIRYVLFLEREAHSLFLRQVGGGFGFFHRTFMEYCASLPEEYSSDNSVS